MKFNSNYLILAGLLVFVGVQAFIRLSGGTKGESAPDFSTQLVNGEDFSLSELEGNYVVLDFWGSWCRPCLVENPKLVALHDKYNNRTFSDGDGFKVVTVALEKTEDQWKLAVRRFGFSWEHQIVEHASLVIMSSIANAYGVTEIPSKFLIGPDGTLLMANQSFEEMDQFLSTKLK